MAVSSSTSRRRLDGRLHARIADADQEDRRPCAPQHGLADRPNDQAADAAPAVRAHHDQIRIRPASGFQD